MKYLAHLIRASTGDTAFPRPLKRLYQVGDFQNQKTARMLFRLQYGPLMMRTFPSGSASTIFANLAGCKPQAKKIAPAAPISSLSA